MRGLGEGVRGGRGRDCCDALVGDNPRWGNVLLQVWEVTSLLFVVYDGPRLNRTHISYGSQGSSRGYYSRWNGWR